MRGVTPLSLVWGGEEVDRRIEANRDRAIRIDKLRPDRGALERLQFQGELPDTPPEALKVEEWIKRVREEDETPRLALLRRLLALEPTYRQPIPVRKGGTR